MIDPWPHDGVLTWATDSLADRGCRLVAEPAVVRAYPWATTLALLVAPGLDGPGPERVWVKSSAPPFAYEMRLLAVLSALAPQALPTVIDLAPEQGFALLADGGPTIEHHPTVETWTQMLVRYGEVQRVLADHPETLLAAGLPDLRPTRAAEALAELTRWGDVLAVGEPYGLTEREADDVRLLLPTVHAVAARLETADMPATVQHDDLQPSNVLADGRLIDWGDASLAHPFASLRTALGPGMERPGTPVERGRMRDAYLTAFADRSLSPADLADLREQARLAGLLAPAGRILAWLRVPGALELYPDAVTIWWRRILASDWRVE